MNVLPEYPTSLDDLVAHATGSVDPEGQAVTYKYAWYRNGIRVRTVEGEPISDLSLSHSYTARDDVMRCDVTPQDGLVAGTPGQDSVVIQNTPPPSANVRI